MGIIERNLTIVGKRPKRVVAFFDSGSSFSIVKKSVLDDVGFIKRKKVNIKLELGNGDYLIIKESVLLELKMNRNSYFHWFLVGNVPEQLVVGVDFLQKYGHTLEFSKDKIRSKNLHLKNRRGKFVL